MANHSEVSVSISCSNFIGIAMINEVIYEDEREIRALSDRFDNIKARLDSVVKILEELIDCNDETLVTLYCKCVTVLRKMCSSISTCMLLPSTIPTTMIFCQAEQGDLRFILAWNFLN